MLTRKKWIEENVSFAREVTQGTNIFPETLMAIAIVESQYPVNGVYYPGASPLAKQGNNYFGIKKGVGWSLKLNTKESIALSFCSLCNSALIFSISYC